MCINVVYTLANGFVKLINKDYCGDQLFQKSLQDYSKRIQEKIEDDEASMFTKSNI